MIVVKLLDIVGGKPALEKVLTAELEYKTALTLRRVVKAINGELEAYEAERMKLAEVHCKKTEDGRLQVENNQYVFADATQAQFFQAEMAKLLACEAELDFTPIELEKITGVKFTAIDLSLLEPFLKL